MAGEDTRERILTAAERLFVERVIAFVTAGMGAPHSARRAPGPRFEEAPR